MKRCLTIILLIGLLSFVAVCMGMATLGTRVTSYQALSDNTTAEINAASALAAASGFGTTAITGEVDLLGIHKANGSETYANGVVLLVQATGAADGDTATQYLYGRSDQGPPQLIATIVWTIGTARADGSTATFLWADDAAITDTHLTSLVEADGTGSDRVCSVMFDAAGYRYLYSLFTAQTGDPTTVKCLYRVY